MVGLTFPAPVSDEPLFRDHTKGSFGQVDQALSWSAATDGGV